MPRSLAAGRRKVTILTTAPVNPGAPTATELNAGIQASPRILASDFMFGPTDSDTIAERALSEEANANALGASNYQFGMSVWRFFDEAGLSDEEADDVYQALKTKGAEVFVYLRETSKRSAEPWVASEEISLGGRVQLDLAQMPSDDAGYIKRRIPGQVQEAWPDIEVATAA